MICQTCGCNNDDTVLYCVNCGAPLKTEAYSATVNNSINDPNSCYIQNEFNNSNGGNVQNNYNGQYNYNGQNNYNMPNGPVNSYSMNGQPVQGGYYGQQKGMGEFDSILKNGGTPFNRMSIKEFLNLPALSNIKKQIVGAGISVYVLVFINALIAVVSQQFSMFWDCGIMLALGLFVHLVSSRVASWLFLVYGVINFLYYIIQLHQVAGWYIIAVGILAIIGTTKLHKAYDEYVRTGYMPNNMIS